MLRDDPYRAHHHEKLTFGRMLRDDTYRTHK